MNSFPLSLVTLEMHDEVIIVLKHRHHHGTFTDQTGLVLVVAE